MANKSVAQTRFTDYLEFYGPTSLFFLSGGCLLRLILGVL